MSHPLPHGESAQIQDLSWRDLLTQVQLVWRRPERPSASRKKRAGKSGRLLLVAEVDATSAPKRARDCGGSVFSAPPY